MSKIHFLGSLLLRFRLRLLRFVLMSDSIALRSEPTMKNTHDGHCERDRDDYA